MRGFPGPGQCIQPAIAGDGPAPNKSIIHSLYHFDLPHNILQKTRNSLESCLRNHQSWARRRSRQGKTAIILGPVENLGRG
jgi:hypothetical protein